jgi:hypothetical protein
MATTIVATIIDHQLVVGAMSDDASAMPCSGKTTDTSQQNFIL